jgi:uncharacterized protein YxeA
MNKNILIVAGVLILLGGAGAFFLLSKNDNTQQTTNNSSTTNQSEQKAQEEEKAETTNGNIFSLSDSGHSHKCMFTYSGSNGTGNGTMYTDGKGRGLMTIEVKTEKGNTGKSNTLVLSDKVYGWTETEGKAIGFTYDKSTLTNGSGNSSSGSNVDPSQKFDLNCEDWSVDESTLAVPTNVNFMTLPTAN